MCPDCGYDLLGSVDAGGRVCPECGWRFTLGELARRGRKGDWTPALGYRRAVTVDGGTLGKAGTAFRGHEFHYAEVIEEGPGEPLFHAAGAEAQDLGPAGLVDGNVAGSFIHLIDRE